VNKKATPDKIRAWLFYFEGINDNMVDIEKAVEMD